MFTGKQSLKRIARISSIQSKKVQLEATFLCVGFVSMFFFSKFAAQPSKPSVLTVAIEKPEIRNYDDDDNDDDDDDDVDDGKDDEDDTQDDDDNDDGFVHEDIDDDDSD